MWIKHYTAFPHATATLQELIKRQGGDSAQIFRNTHPLIGKTVNLIVSKSGLSMSLLNAKAIQKPCKLVEREFTGLSHLR